MTNRFQYDQNDTSDAPIRQNGTPVPTIVRKIKAALEFRDIRVAEFEAETGIGTSKFYHWTWKSGSPSVPQLQAIAKFLGTTLEYLVNDEIPVADNPPGESPKKGINPSDN